MGRWTTRQGPAMARLRSAIEEAKDLETKIGWFPSAVYPDGTPVAYVATIQEYGDPGSNIPPRSFMRTTYDARQNAWFELMGKGVGAIARGEKTITQVMELLSLLVEGDVRKKITEIYDPPLAESTIKARARKYGKTPETVSTKPLNASGLMLATLTSQTGKKS